MRAENIALGESYGSPLFFAYSLSSLCLKKTPGFGAEPQAGAHNIQKWINEQNGPKSTVFYCGKNPVILCGKQHLGEDWCKDCNPTGIIILGVNIEELLWDYSWGTIGGVLYEFISGRGYSFTSESNKINVEKILSNFLNYDRSFWDKPSESSQVVVKTVS
jgi:hypothetical protein